MRTYLILFLRYLISILEFPKPVKAKATPIDPDTCSWFIALAKAIDQGGRKITQTEIRFALQHLAGCPRCQKVISDLQVAIRILEGKAEFPPKHRHLKEVG